VATWWWGTAVSPFVEWGAFTLTEPDPRLGLEPGEYLALLSLSGSQGMLGIIPGSMGDAGYVVQGRGEKSALRSASHGAGRAMSRRAALDSVTKTGRDQYLRQRGVTLLGGGLDEAPQAYKPTASIIAAQRDLVEIIGTFLPRVVRMADEPGDM
jgi:RNA-splicing ligase RtcB